MTLGTILLALALVAGGLIWGFDPLTTLSGTRIDAGRALVLTGAGITNITSARFFGSAIAFSVFSNPATATYLLAGG